MDGIEGSFQQFWVQKIAFALNFWVQKITFLPVFWAHILSFQQHTPVCNLLL